MLDKSMHLKPRLFFGVLRLIMLPRWLDKRMIRGVDISGEGG
jgi:hypothetical protein